MYVLDVGNNHWKIKRNGVHTAKCIKKCWKSDTLSLPTLFQTRSAYELRGISNWLDNFLKDVK